MRRFFTTIIFIVFGSLFAVAQKTSILKVAPRTDPTISPRERLFAIDTLIDARIDTSSLIGTWQAPNGKISELHFKDGFQPTLSTFLMTSLPKINEKITAYTLLVQEFNISNVPGRTRFELAVTFNKRTDSTHTAFITLTDSVTNQVSAPVYRAEIIAESNSKSITELLKQGLATAFVKFNEYLANPDSRPPVYSDFALEMMQAAQDLALVKSTYDSIRTDEDNLLRCHQLRSGVYQNFSELRQNRPSLTGELVVQEKKGFAYLQKPSGSKDKHWFYGFSDGKDIFICTRLYQNTGFTRRYAKVKSIGRYLLWIDNYVTSGETTANAIGASFGIIGVIAASSAKSYKDCIALDIKTGGVFLVTKNKMPALLAGHADLLSELATLTNPRDEQEHLRLLDKLNRRLCTPKIR